LFYLIFLFNFLKRRGMIINIRRSVMNRLKKAGFILLAVFCMVMLYGGETQGEDVSSKTSADEEAYPWELGTFEGLDAKTEWRIIQDHYDTCKRAEAEWWIVQNYYGTNFEPAFPLITVNDIRIINYYGTYNARVVVTIEDGLPYAMAAIVPRPYQIDGIVFPWLDPSYPFPTVWNNGKFYDIAELYLSGRLTRGDLKSIAGYPQNRNESRGGKR
jgi:hypothetical protein